MVNLFYWLRWRCAVLRGGWLRWSGQLHQTCLTVDEVIGEHMCDPEMRKLIEAQRKPLRGTPVTNGIDDE